MGAGGLGVGGLGGGVEGVNYEGECCSSVVFGGHGKEPSSSESSNMQCIFQKIFWISLLIKQINEMAIS